MTERGRRAGTALVSILALVSLVALLAVATLSVSTRLQQGSSLASRNALLDAAAAFGLATAVADWRVRGFAALAVGQTVSLVVPVPASGISVTVSVTRLTTEVYWTVSESAAPDGSSRRESQILRFSTPSLDSLPGVLATGDVLGSGRLNVSPDSLPGCAGAPRVERSPATVDSNALFQFGGWSALSLATTPDRVLSGSSLENASEGIVHALGDLTLTSGSGKGVLIVEGRLTIAGPLTFTGLIIARKGMAVIATGVRIVGAARVGAFGDRAALRIEAGAELTIIASRCAVQAVVASALMPRPVAGRRWAEIF